MAGAPAYRYDYDYDYDSAYPYEGEVAGRERARFTAVPSRGFVEQLDPRWYILARVILALVVIFAIAGVIRIEITSAALAASVEYEQVTTDITAARAEGSALEVQAANLSNPAYVKDYAAHQLGMVAPTTVETLTLAPDVVVTDESGALSLSQSLAAVAGR